MRRRLPLAALAAALTAVATVAPVAGAAPRARAGAARSAAATRAASAVYIGGGGFGHGIGMSQYGALGYAEHGRDYRSILAHYYSGTSLGTVDPSQLVRVLLKTGSAAFSGANAAAGKKLNPSLTYSVVLRADGSLAIVDPSGHKLVSGAAPLMATGPGPLTVAGLGSYRGALEFRPDGSGGVQTVDAVGLDDYVRGVIAAEMPSSWPGQALDVQAVAARTYALTTSVAGNGYTLYPDTRSQMYGGVSAETTATDAAVAATAGQVVTLDGTPVATYFSSSSGGHTENNEDVWLGAPPDSWLRGVPDPYDGAGGNPHHRWTATLSTSAAAARLGALVHGRLIGVRVVSHGVSGRIVYADVVGTQGTVQVTGAQLESAFKLLSTPVSFTTITTVASSSATIVHGREMRSSWLPASAAEAAFSSLAPAVHAAIAGAHRGVHGSVYPGRAGARVTVQQLGRHGWHIVGRARLSKAGAYSVRLKSPGRYRVVFHKLHGPVVTVR